MADASERAVRCSTCLQMVHPDLPHSCYDAALHSAVTQAVAQERARVLADVIAMVGEWFSESRSYIVTSEELAMLNSCESNLLTRLRAMEGHTDGTV